MASTYIRYRRYRRHGERNSRANEINQAGWSPRSVVLCDFNCADLRGFPVPGGAVRTEAGRRGRSGDNRRQRGKGARLRRRCGRARKGRKNVHVSDKYSSEVAQRERKELARRVARCRRGGSHQDSRKNELSLVGRGCCRFHGLRGGGSSLLSNDRRQPALSPARSLPLTPVLLLLPLLRHRAPASCIVS